MPEISAVRVLVGADVPSNSHGGVAQVLYNLRDHLRLEGIQADLVFLDSVPKWLQTIFPARATFPFVFLIYAFKGRKKYDVVQGKGSDGWIYGIFRRIFKNLLPPYVLLSFELENLAWRKEKEEAFIKRSKIRFKTRITYPVTQLLPLQVALRTADHLLISNHDLDYIKSRFDDYTVHYNGVPSHFFINRERYQVSPVGVMFNLTWHWRKSICDLPEIFRRILTFDEAYITLVTPKPPAWVLQMKEDYSGRFHVYSDIPLDNLVRLYTENQIFVDPSVSSPFPLLVVLEAMASGMAIVATSVCYADRIIEHGYNGYLVTPRDADGIIKRLGILLRDTGLRQTMGQRSQQTAWNYEWKRNVQTYVKVYRELMR